jgi:hypothetical protein
LADLPGIDELKAAGLLDPRPAASLADMAGETAPVEPSDDAGDDAEALAQDLEPDPPLR